MNEHFIFMLQAFRLTFSMNLCPSLSLSGKHHQKTSCNLYGSINENAGFLFPLCCKSFNSICQVFNGPEISIQEVQGNSDAQYLSC